jgi:hypothetical protein
MQMRYTKYFLVAVVLASFLPTLGRPTAPTLGTKMVYIDAQYQVDPVTITKVQEGDQTIQPGLSTGSREDKPGAPFQADDDWLKNMSVVLQNRTNQTIVRAEIEVFFLGGGQSQGVATYFIKLGQRPDAESFTKSGEKRPPEQPSKQPLFFPPGQTLVLHISDYAEAMQALIEAKVPFSEVTRIAFLRERFYFADGMRWDDLVGFGIPDPKHPGQYTNFDRQTYFPGDAEKNWPPNEFWTPPGREHKTP